MLVSWTEIIVNRHRINLALNISFVNSFVEKVYFVIAKFGEILHIVTSCFSQDMAILLDDPHDRDEIINNSNNLDN